MPAIAPTQSLLHKDWVGRSLMEEKACASPSICPLVDTLRGLEVLQIGESAVLDYREVLLASAMSGVSGRPGYGVLANFS